MNHRKKNQDFVTLTVIAGLFFACLLSSGCKDTAPPTATAGKKIPKLYLHCPTQFDSSVKRLREIHDVLTSSDPVPEPVVCKVVEFIHGEGAAAHSHYYLAGQAPDDDHHHEDETSEEQFHEIQIDIFTEFRDVAWILPNISADSDMEEADWLAAKKAAWGMVELLEEAISDGQSTDEKREVFLENKTQLDDLLNQLEAIAPANESSESNSNENLP